MRVKFKATQHIHQLNRSKQKVSFAQAHISNNKIESAIKLHPNKIACVRKTSPDILCSPK